MLDFETLKQATADLVRRSGAESFALGRDTDGSRWVAVATFYARQSKSGSGTTPHEACNTLAVELLDGKVCRACNHVIVVGGSDLTTCNWTFNGALWQSGCRMPVDKTIAMVEG